MAEAAKYKRLALQLKKSNNDKDAQVLAPSWLCCNINMVVSIPSWLFQYHLLFQHASCLYAGFDLTRCVFTAGGGANHLDNQSSSGG